MKSFYCIRNFVLAIATMFISTVCSAQNTITEVNDSLGLRTYSALRGDTLLIAYDSAFILNKITYKLYKENYARVANKDFSTKKLMEEYEILINKQDSMLKEKEFYYQSLKTNFDSLSSTATVFADETDANLKAIDTSLTNANNQITSIKISLDSALEKLKQENKQKIKVAIGGFAVGVGIASLIFLIAK